jgi:hypothetical protein
MILAHILSPPHPNIPTLNNIKTDRPTIVPASSKYDLKKTDRPTIVPASSKYDLKKKHYLLPSICINTLEEDFMIDCCSIKAILN